MAGTKPPRWLRVFNQGSLERVEQLFSPALVLHFADTLLPATPPSLPGVRQLVTLLRTAFPDLTFTLQAQAGQGQTHAYTWAARGTHRGPFMRVRATGRAVAFPGRFLMRLEEDKIVELWIRMNLLPVLSQLGMAPGGTR